MGFFSEFGKAVHEGDGEVAKCSRCGSDDIQYQTVTESRKTGFWTIVFYIALAITLIGLLVVIPLALRRKTETVTYAVCQNCGNRWEISRT